MYRCVQPVSLSCRSWRHWRRHNHLQRVGDNFDLNWRVTDDLAIGLDRQWLIGADRNATFGSQVAHISVAALLTQERMPDQAQVIQRGARADNAHVDLAVVG